MGYTRKTIIDKCEKAFNDIKTFYKQPLVNYSGKTIDTIEYYTEVISEFLIDNLNLNTNPPGRYYLHLGVFFDMIILQ